MLHDGRRMAAHLLENYKTDSSESAQLDLFPQYVLVCRVKGPVRDAKNHSEGSEAQSEVM